jgi:hypothetical protein
MKIKIRPMIGATISLGTALLSLVLSNQAAAAPYNFTPQDYIAYGIYFSPGGRQRATKLMDIRFGNIKGYYNEYLRTAKEAPTTLQYLNLKTKQGSVFINENNDQGLSVTRDVYNLVERSGTKRLDVSFNSATCTDSSGLKARCAVTLTLTTDGPDKGASSARRTMTIRTSTGLNFQYQSRAKKAGTPYTLADLRATKIANYASDWRPSSK